MHFLDAIGLVLLRAGAQRSDQAAEVLPGCVAKDEGAGWEVVVAEGAEEWVEVVRRGGEVEPSWVLEFGFEMGVELRHAGDGEGLLDAEGIVQDAERGRCLGDFDCVVDIADDSPACGFCKVGRAFETEWRW